MKKLRAYLKSKKYKADGQPSSGGDANADLNQPILGKSNSGTGKKGQEALKVSKLRPNNGKPGDFGTFQKKTLNDEAVHGSSKKASVKQDGNQKGHNMKGPNPVTGKRNTQDGSGSSKKQGNQTGLNPLGPNKLKARSSNSVR